MACKVSQQMTRQYYNRLMKQNFENFDETTIISSLKEYKQLYQKYYREKHVQSRKIYQKKYSDTHKPARREKRSKIYKLDNAPKSEPFDDIDMIIEF